MSLGFKIMPRWVNGEDRAPDTARKTDTAYIAHDEYADAYGIPYVVGADESAEDALLTDPAVLEVVDKIALAEELEQAILEGGV